MKRCGCGNALSDERDELCAACRQKIGRELRTLEDMGALQEPMRVSVYGSMVAVMQLIAKQHADGRDALRLDEIVSVPLLKHPGTHAQIKVQSLVGAVASALKQGVGYVELRAGL